MDSRIREALEGSIRKWREIASGAGLDRGDENCPLCRLFFDGDCKGCPVAEWVVSNVDGWDPDIVDACCEETPYTEWCRHHRNYHRDVCGPYKVECDECRRIALKEVEFLEGLREQEVQGE